MLSAVTIAVLAIGVAVIQSARSSDTVESTSSNRQDTGRVIPPAPQPNEEEVIVITGSPPTPTQLPATTPETSPQYETEGATLPYTAELPNDGALDRL
jgi:hypothetical protein